MGYFDDPKHKAQWEKELSALRQEKERIRAGLPPVSDQAERTISREPEKTIPENDSVSREQPGRAPRETATANVTPDKRTKTESARAAAVPGEVRTAKPEPAAEVKKTAAAERKAPSRPAAERARSGEAHRVKISFEELLRRENMYTPPKLTQKPREPERQKEVSHVL